MKPLDYPYAIIRPVPTMRCNFHCEYCANTEYQPDLSRINLFAKEEVSPDKWIERLATLRPKRFPFTTVFCAREPAMYEGFSDIVNSIDYPNSSVRIYSNASTRSLDELRKVVPRNNVFLYVSYHPKFISVDEFAENAKELTARFNIINFHAVPYPKQKEQIEEDARILASMGIRVVTDHPYIGWYNGEYHFYGDIGELPKFKNRFMPYYTGEPERTVYCKSSFNHTMYGNSSMNYPIAPNGDVYACWRFILNHSDEGILGNIFDDGFEFKDEYYECRHYGGCNMCAWDKDIIDKETGEQLDTDVVAWGRIA